jgi:hypothetical protein
VAHSFHGRLSDRLFKIAHLLKKNAVTVGPVLSGSILAQTVSSLNCQGRIDLGASEFLPGFVRKTLYAAEEFLCRVTKTNGAGDRDRTGDIQLGKLAFYR